MNGLLAKIYSESNRLKRYIGDIANDPYGNLQQRVNSLNDQAKEFNDIHSAATDESINSLMTGGSQFSQGPASNRLASILSDAYGPVGMIKIHGRGQIPETAGDVKKLSERFGKLLDQSGTEYTFDKSKLSPARYFEFENPKDAGEVFKVRISDHRNVHGADFSVDPHTGATFEEMLKHVQSLGVPIKDRVTIDRSVGKKVSQKINKLLDIGEGSFLRMATKKYGGINSDAFGKSPYKELEQKLYEIANRHSDTYSKETIKEIDELVNMLNEAK